MTYHHLTPFERGRIDAMKKYGHTIRFISKELSRSPSTISRELRKMKDDNYSAENAQPHYVESRKNVRPKGKANPNLCHLIEDRLKASWSPEQIVGRLLSGKLSFKTIFRWLYSGILNVDLDVLRHKGKSRNSAETRGKFTVGLSIRQRPKEIAKRESVGHWEADTIVSSRGKSKGCIATFAERRSRLFPAF